MPRPDRRILLQFLVSYGVVLALACTTGALAYVTAFAAVDTSVRQANRTILLHTREIIDRRLDEIGEMVSALAYDPDIASLLPVSDVRDPRGFALMRRTWKSLPRFQATNSMIFDYYVHFRNSRVVMSPDTLSFHLDRFYGSVLSHGGLSLEDWTALTFDTPHRQTLLTPETVVLQGNSHRLLAYLQSLPLGHAPYHAATVLVYLRAAALTDLLERLDLPRGGFACVEDSRGRRLVTLAADGVDIPSLDRGSLDARGYEKRLLAGGRYHVAYTVSPRTGWLYVAGVPERHLSERVSGVRRVALASLALAILVGGLVAYALAWRTSRPLSELAARLGTRADSSGGAPAAGISGIARSVSRLLERNALLNQALREQEPLVRAAVVDGLLRGDWTGQRELEAQIDQLDLDLRGAAFVCLILKIGSLDQAASPEVLQETQRARVIVHDTIRALAGEHGFCHDVDLDTVALVLRLDQDAAGRLWLRIAAALRARGGVAARAYGGRVVSSALEIHRSYAEARDVLAREPEGDPGGVLWYGRPPAGRPQWYFYPMDLEWTLMKSVRTGNWPQVRSILEHLRQENVGDGRLDPLIARNLFYELRGTCIKLLSQMPQLDPQQLAPLRRDVEALDPGLPLDATFDALGRFLAALAAAALTNRRLRAADVTRRIVLYLEASYADPQMCLSKAAGSFGLSEVYLSQLFKAETGETFSGFLTRKRLEKARALLSEGRLSIDQVAAEVGYSSTDTFRRAFRRSYGTSPHSYRLGMRSRSSRMGEQGA